MEKINNTFVGNDISTMFSVKKLYRIISFNSKIYKNNVNESIDIKNRIIPLVEINKGINNASCYNLKITFKFKDGYHESSSLYNVTGKDITLYFGENDKIQSDATLSLERNQGELVAYREKRFLRNNLSKNEYQYIVVLGLLINDDTICDSRLIDVAIEPIFDIGSTTINWNDYISVYSYSPALDFGDKRVEDVFKLKENVANNIIPITVLGQMENFVPVGNPGSHNKDVCVDGYFMYNKYDDGRSKYPITKYNIKGTPNGIHVSKLDFVGQMSEYDGEIRYAGTTEERPTKCSISFLYYNTDKNCFETNISKNYQNPEWKSLSFARFHSSYGTSEQRPVPYTWVRDEENQKYIETKHELVLGDAYFDETINRVLYLTFLETNDANTAVWRCADGVLADTKRVGTSAERPSKNTTLTFHRLISNKTQVLEYTKNVSSGLYAGFEYFDTTLNKTIWWNGTNWIDKDGNSADTKKLGTTAERPSKVEIGFIYKDTTLNKLILWEGSKWVNLDGSELS